ncbi:nucleotidyltransferase domain-containing protein [bacterium]|nr:nucleotidyltransferase domain-containing protein [bacterium]MBU1873229.1 nucleotidyltransferase domain-containing protein [bacterium]
MEMNKDYIINFISTQKPELQKSYGVRRIGLFGSYAKGCANQDSDIDIVVEIDKPDLFIMIGIKQFLEESLGAHIDIVRLRDKMNLALRKRIEQDAIYV